MGRLKLSFCSILLLENIASVIAYVKQYIAKYLGKIYEPINS